MFNQKDIDFLTRINSCILCRVAEEYEYCWDANFSAKYIEESFKDFIDFYKKNPQEIPDFKAKTTQELKVFGFKKFSQTGIILIPLYLKQILPQDMEVVSIFGDKTKLSEVDNDNRAGVLAYGFYLNE